MATLSTVRIRRHRLLVGGQWSDPAEDETAATHSPATSKYWELHLPFGGWAGKASGRGRVGGRHIFDAMTQIRSVAFDVAGGTP